MRANLAVSKGIEPSCSDRQSNIITIIWRDQIMTRLVLTHHSILLPQKPSLLIPYWNTLLHRPTKNWAGTGLYALRLSGIISCRCKVFQYGVLSSLFMPAIVNSTRTPYIVGLVRLCLGSTMTSSDLPPDLHSNHIETSCHLRHHRVEQCRNRS